MPTSMALPRSSGGTVTVWCPVTLRLQQHAMVDLYYCSELLHMTSENQIGEVEERTREKVLSLGGCTPQSGIYTNGKLYTPVSIKHPNFELTPHTKGSKSGLLTGMIHDTNGISEQVGFIELTAPVGQLDIGAIYYISSHLDYLSSQVDCLNRSLQVVQSGQKEILNYLHTSLLASLKQAGSDFKFALSNLDTIAEQQLHSAYMPSIISGIQNAEKALHEKTLHWEDRLKFADYDGSLWRKMPEEIEKSVYFKSLFVTAVGHAAQALLMNGNEHILALSRLKLRELAKPLVNIIEKCKGKKDWIHDVLGREYDPSANYGMYSWDRDAPDVAISKLMAHADRMSDAIEYLVNLSFVDCLNPKRAYMVLEVTEGRVGVSPPLPVPEPIKNLLLDRG